MVERVSLSGHLDYLLRVVVQDISHCARFIMETLFKHQIVDDCKTGSVRGPVKNTSGSPA